MQVREAAREGFLYQLWVNQPFDQPLHTIDGRPVQILEKGVRNYDAGPDFLNALIVLDGRMQRGDVEIHPLAGDWYSHHHHTDPRYNSVLLHIVTMHIPEGFVALRQDRTPVATLNLDEFLQTPCEELEVEPLTVDTKQLPLCRLQEQDAACQERVLQQAGMARLQIKAQRLAEMRLSAGWQQIVYSSLAVSLGYAKNHLPFSRLAQLLPVERLWSYLWNDDVHTARTKCEAYLFGVSGLLPFTGRESESEYARRLLDCWASFPDQAKIDPIRAGSWQFFRLRPSNFPTRRIAALAELVLRFSQEGFLTPFIKSLETFKERPKPCISEMETRLEVRRHDFWSSRYTFDQPEACGCTSTALVGRDRSRDMVINVMLPALYAYGQETEAHRTLAAVRDLYAQFPAMAHNEITRWMQARLFHGRSEPLQRMSRAIYQQGLVHLYKSVCIGQGDCRRCLE
ncbi:MAG TPA: DUF2851 family protein [bacterium]|nr:DUF2851 family protein [bacterium]